tara:strand:+ start:606 stop:1232 length:627 start_codon:yes stop_codon:yes gene_type:complete
MINYQQGRIYKIINTDTNDIVYVGSTTQQLSHRYTKHKHKAPNHKIILIENYPCNSKEELCMKEQQFIEQKTNLLNKLKAYRSEEQKKEYKKEWRKNNKEYYIEWCKNNKEQIKEKTKEWREENKKKYKEYQKEYRENNKTEISEKAKTNYENNKTKILEKQKKYNEDNKEHLKEKINCEFCNCLSSRIHLKRHQKSIKCMKFQCIED